MNLFDVIIPTYRNIKELEQCLQGFSRQTFPDFRILLCIDGDPEEVNKYLSKNTFSCDLIPLQHPDRKRKGRNATRNLALQSLESKYLLMFDSDIIPSPRVIEQHYELLSCKDCISIGEVTYKNSEINILADYVQSRVKHKFNDKEFIPYKYYTSQNTGMKSKYYIKVGGQDAAIKSYGGDVEFSHRLEKTFSLPLIYNKKAAGFTVWTKNMDTTLNQMQEFGAVTLPYLKKKYPDLKKAFRIDLVTFKGVKGIMIRIMVNDILARIFRTFIKLFPRIFKRKIIQYLFFRSMVKGYDSHKD